jgi:hypothetical protein
VLAQLETDSAVTVEKDVVRKREHTRAMTGADAELRDRLEKVYREAKLAAPSLAEAFAKAGVNASALAHGRKLLQVLIDAGSLVRVDGEMFFHRAALDELIARLREGAKEALRIAQLTWLRSKRWPESRASMRFPCSNIWIARG